MAVVLADSERGALHIRSEFEMAADTDQITTPESETLQSESRAARVLDQQLAADLRRDRLVGATSSAGICGILVSGPGCRSRWSVGSCRRPRVGIGRRGSSWWRR